MVFLHGHGCNQNDAKVEVYANAHSIKLLLNGKEVGVQKIEELKTLFTVKYEPGALEAISLDENGKEIARSKLVSAKENDVNIVLTPEEKKVRLNEIVYVKVRISDSDGIIESNDDSTIKLKVVGGDLLGFGSGNPRSEEKFTTGEYTTYYGRALAVIRCTQKGFLNVMAEDNKGRKASTEVLVF